MNKTRTIYDKRYIEPFGPLSTPASGAFSNSTKPARSDNTHGCTRSIRISPCSGKSAQP